MDDIRFHFKLLAVWRVLDIGDVLNEVCCITGVCRLYFAFLFKAEKENKMI